MFNINFEQLSLPEARRIVESNTVGLILLVFGNSIKSVYIIGSQVDESFEEGSDLDLVVISDHLLDVKAFKAFENYVSHICALPLDIKLFRSVLLQNREEILDPCIFHKRRLVYGEECIDQLKVAPELHLRDNVKKLAGSYEALFCCEQSPAIFRRHAYRFVARICRLVIYTETGNWSNSKSESCIRFADSHPSLSELPRRLASIYKNADFVYDVQALRSELLKFYRECVEIAPILRFSVSDEL